jgi:hypothetical protein
MRQPAPGGAAAVCLPSYEDAPMNKKSVRVHEILFFVLAIGLLGGWYWHSSAEKARRDVEEAQRIQDYEGLNQETIRILSEGADKLAAVADPVQDDSSHKIANEVLDRVKELYDKKLASWLPWPKRKAAEERAEAEMRAAWARWDKQLARISTVLAAESENQSKELQKLLDKMLEKNK